MNPAVGFTASWRSTGSSNAGTDAALANVLAHFPDLRQHTVCTGETRLTVWGRGEVKDCLHSLPDGSLLALIGSPLLSASPAVPAWKQVEENLLAARQLTDYRLPWDGRVVLLHISPDGSRWTIWNDWLGSIPVFYTYSAHSRTASTLEPAVFAANSFTQDDFDWPAILFMLMHGHYLGDWTFFKPMKTLLPDSVTTCQADQWSTIACSTIQPNTTHWETDYETLIEMMHAVSSQAILSSLKTHRRWTLPLSSGLDSRLIAAVGAKAGCSMEAYSWGPPDTQDTIFAGKIAERLGIPWKRIDLGENYLSDYLALWAALFGTSMHFHGTYQMPFLDALRGFPSAPIATGFLGEALAGTFSKYAHKVKPRNQRQIALLPDGYLNWKPEDLPGLLKFDVHDCLEQIADEIERQVNCLEGAFFQRFEFLNLWNRQRSFISFQSTMSDYWHGTASPYMNREYARLSFSLPRAVLDGRRLELDMMRRYYPHIINIPGTYAPEPAILTGSYLFKKRASKLLPKSLVKYLLPEFSASRYIESDVKSLRQGGEKALWPIPETKQQLGGWVNLDALDLTYQEAIGGSKKAVRKLQAIQAVAYRIK